MQLQVSLVRQFDDSPQIDVGAAWAHRASAASSSVLRAPARTPGARGDDVIRTVVRVPAGAVLAIEQIAAEQNLGEDRVPLCFSGNSIKSIEVAAGGPASERESSEGPPLSRVFELPGEPFSSGTCPVIVKVVAVDRNGRRAAGWATVRERATQQVAANTSARH
jgi:hypothetical protein